MTTDAVAEQASTKSKQRARQSAGDMVRSLSVVLGIVLVVYYFAQPPDSDKQAFREVDPSADVRAFARVAPAALVPGPAPQGWRSNVTQYVVEPAALRVGWNIPPSDSPGYVEYAATTGPSDDFVADLTDRAQDKGPVDVGGAAWSRYVADDGTVSFVRKLGAVTIVIGTKRGEAQESDLRLAISRLVPAATIS